MRVTSPTRQPSQLDLCTEFAGADDQIGPCAWIAPGTFSEHSWFGIGHMRHQRVDGQLFSAIVQVTSHSGPLLVVYEFQYKRL
jgi:hypothetical protein